MKTILASKLYEYLRDNNPDILFRLGESNSTGSYIKEKLDAVELIIQQNKPAYQMEYECMNMMTADLRPSKFNYIRNILEDEFPKDFQRLHDSGVLIFEVINMISTCKDVFDKISLTEENEDDSMLRSVVTGVISDYLQDVMS
jgi:hypothetical protein